MGDVVASYTLTFHGLQLSHSVISMVRLGFVIEGFLANGVLSDELGCCDQAGRDVTAALRRVIACDQFALRLPAFEVSVSLALEGLPSLTLCCILYRPSDYKLTALGPRDLFQDGRQTYQLVLT